MNKLIGVIATLSLAVLTASPARAQLNGNDIKNDRGVKAATQPPPGVYAGTMWQHVNADEIRGRRERILPGNPDASINAWLPYMQYVSKVKVLGANYGVDGMASVQNNAFAAPFFGVDQSSGYGWGDSYFRPIVLGWHNDRADYLTAVGLYFPSGRFEADSVGNNRGLGQTTLELSGGGTFYLNEAKSWSAATLVYWEAHSPRKDVQTEVGEILTLKGGLGKSFKQGAWIVGFNYFAQWKLTADSFDDPVLDALADVNKDRVFGIGPDITLPIAANNKLISQINIRADWEFGAKSTTQGFTSLVTFNFPVPSLKLQ